MNLRLSLATRLIICNILLSSPTFADLVLNGSFEDPPATVETQFFNGQTIGTGWTVISGNTAFIIPNNVGQGVTPFGNQFLEIHSDSIGQTINGLIVGTSYTLSYYATVQTDSNYFGTGQIIATIAGQSDNFSYTVNGTNLYGSLALPWTQRVLNFTATNTSELLTFSGSGSLNQNPLAAIDNVSITAVPEPSSITLGILATTCGFSLRRRKANNNALHRRRVNSRF